MIALEYAVKSGEYVAVQCTFVKIHPVISPQSDGKKYLIISYDTAVPSGGNSFKLLQDDFLFIRVNGKELGA